MRRLLFFLVYFLITIQLIAQNPTQWRGSNRDGIYLETNLLKSWPDEGPQLLWNNNELGIGHASAAVTKNAIYTTGMENGNGNVLAFDLSGKLLWKTEYGAEWTENFEGARVTPLVDNNKIYIFSSFGKMVCLSSSDGKLIWEVDCFKEYDGRNITWGLTENLLIEGDMVFCCPGGTDANVLALNKNTGKLIWKSKGNGEKSAYCSPNIISIAGKKIMVTQTSASILGIDISNGMLLWRHDQPNQWSVHPNTPLYKDKMLYCVSGYGKGGVMLKLSDDGNKVSEVWRDTSLDTRLGGVILVNGRIYGTGDKTRKLICLDCNSGKVLFSESIMAPGNVIFADGMIYAYSEAGKVGLIEPLADKFNLISSFKVPFGAKQHWAHLVIANKKLYVRHGNSLMVYDIAAK